MAYQEPKRQIFQEFEQAVTQGAAPLHACCVGPLYALHRYDLLDEKAGIGAYDYAATTMSHLWPEHVPGGRVDLATARLVLENAVMRYYQGVANAELVTTNSNKLVSSLVFKTNAAAARDVAAFGNRDVAVGDTVRLSWTAGAVFHEVFTKVAGFQADTVPGSAAPVEAPFREKGFGTTAEAVVVDVIAPTKLTCTYSAANYNGLADGYPRDTYTLQVLAIGAGGTGLLDGTVLRITSAGGDPQQVLTLGTDVVFGAAYVVPLGSRGATVSIVNNAGGTLHLNDIWSVTVSQDYAEVSVDNPLQWSAAGNPNYTGTTNTKYLLTVVVGGETGVDELRVFYRTNNGADTSGYLTLASADFTGSTKAYPIGNHAVKLIFHKNTQWNTGDVVSFSMAAAGAGAIHTLLLQDPVQNTAWVQMNMDLFVVQTQDFPVGYQTLTADSITVTGNAATMSDLLGTPKLMSLFSGTLYADYRELRVDLPTAGFIATEAERQAVLGPATSSNPLGKAVYHALVESGYAVGVYYMAITDESLAGYQEALGTLTENDAIYSVVALSTDETVLQAVRAHVLDRSTPINNQWRSAWVPNTTKQLAAVYAANGSADVVATVSVYPVGVYRQIDSSNGLFVTHGVRAGDLLRINYATDGDGVVTFDTYTVDRVNSETQLITVEDLGGPIPVDVKIEIWRQQTKDEYAAALALKAHVYNTRRVVCVYADNPVELDGTPVELYYVCAALAGQRAGVPPHAPMSQLDLLSIVMDPKVGFSRDQMNVIAAGGNWIVLKDYTGRVFTRHQITSVSNADNFLEREQSKTTNLDHISRDFLSATADLFGQGNISPAMLSLIDYRLTQTIQKIKNRNYSDKLGAQMLNAQITKLERDSVLRDTVLVEINPDMPDPLNNLPITFRVS